MIFTTNKFNYFNFNGSQNERPQVHLITQKTTFFIPTGLIVSKPVTKFLIK